MEGKEEFGRHNKWLESWAEDEWIGGFRWPLGAIPIQMY